MKKSLVALAVLGAFAGTASAQSSVTIYGVLDLGIQKSNNTGAGFAPNPGAPGNSAYNIAQSTTSRLGFRGTEDLGGGMSAQFQIEHRLNPDTGAQQVAGSFWNGRSFVQLTTAGVGAVYLGREYNPAFWVQLKSDPFGNDGVGQSSASATYAGYFSPDQPVNGTPTTPFNNTAASARTSNTIGFKSANFSGLTVQGAVSLSEATQQGRNLGFNAEYTAGPLYAGFGWESIKGGNADGLGMMNAALHYDLGVVKLIGYLARSETRGATARAEVKNSMWKIGATAPLGGGLVKMMYYKVNPAGVNNTRTKLGLGYNYPLSKRTNLYADMGLARADSLKNNNAYGFGVRHNF